MKRPNILDYQYSDRLQFSVDVDRYIDYIEHQNKKLIERMDKARNILIESNSQPNSWQLLNTKY
jgi:flagellar biosynthesis chaperone FliJ